MIKKLGFTILLLPFYGVVAFTQTQDTASKGFLNYVFKDSVNKDVGDVIRYVFKNNKDKKTKDSTTAKNLQVAILPAVGYAWQTGFAVVVTSNVSFSSDRNNANQKLSTIFAGLTYSQYNQIIFPVVANIWTKKNKLNFILDNRFINYPTYVFGVGNTTNSTYEYNTSFSYLRMHESVLKEVANDFYLGLGYMYDRHYKMNNYTTVYKQINSNNIPKKLTETTSGLAARFLYDNRLNANKPTKGFYSNIVFRKNLTALGSDNNWSYLITDTRAYISFPKKSKNVLALWNVNWLTFGGNNVPIFLLPSNGWDDTHNTGRGYIQGRFRGRNMFSVEAEYRVELTKNGLFGATFFGGLQHFDKEYFYRTATIKPSGGIGLRIKFNKHSNANLCIDYGIGLNGSQGFFVNMSEVF